MKISELLLEYSGRVYFEGILCTLDKPSDASPAGARGHQIELTSNATKNALNSLIGASVNYVSGWKGHNPTITVGFISRAEIVEDKVKVVGFLNTTKYPNIIDEIESLSAEQELGMSYELANAKVEDMRSFVWKITQISSFTGVAILLRSSAAYKSSSFRLLL